MQNSEISRYILVLVIVSLLLILIGSGSKSGTRQNDMEKICGDNDGDYISNDKIYFSKKHSPKLKSDRFKITIVCEDK